MLWNLVLTIMEFEILTIMELVNLLMGPEFQLVQDDKSLLYKLVELDLLMQLHRNIFLMIKQNK